jgi:hypothetical protein
MTRFAMLSLLLSLAFPSFATAQEKGKSSSRNRVFELRTYYTHEGRLDALNKRFRDHTCRLFQKHGIELIGFWTPQEEKNKLVYLIAFPSREAAKASWDAFRKDPEWQKVAKESEEDGKIVKEVVSVYLDPTDYSAIK